MTNYSLDNNRITAFIFIEEKFYSHKYHTECVTEFLKEKKLIKKEEDLYKMLKDKNKEHIARKWIEEIEDNCIFGEVANINNLLSIVVFDTLTEYGIEIIKEQALKDFGIDRLIYARYTGNNVCKFQFIEL